MKKIIKQISIIMAPLIVIAMAIFGSLKSNSQNPNSVLKTEQSVRVRKSRAANPNEKKSPEYLFVTYPVTYTKGAAPLLPSMLVSGLKATLMPGGSKLYSSLIEGELDPSLKDMFYAQKFSGAPVDSAPFKVADSVAKINKFINGIGTIGQDTTIVIDRPKKAFDPMNYIKNSGTVSSPAEPKGTGMDIVVPQDFAYKVATIDLTNVPEGKNVMFDMKDGTKPLTTLVIQNDQKELTDKWDLKDMKALGDIYFRKTEKPVVANTPNKDEALDPNDATTKFTNTPKGVTLTRDGDTISVYVKPTASTDFKFSVNKLTDPGAKGAIKFGLLDNSLSPLHTKENATNSGTVFGGIGAIDASKPLIDVAAGDPNRISLDDLKGYHNTAKWRTETNYSTAAGTITNAEVLTLYMSEGAKISKEIKFNNEGQESFEGNANQFSFQIESGVLSLSPPNFKIIQSKFTGAQGKVMPINLKVIEKPVTSNTRSKKWFKIELAFSKGIINFEQDGKGDEVPFILKKLDENIFFSDPENITGTESNKQIPVVQYVDNSKENIKIIGSIYANWSDLYNPGDPDYIIRPGGVIPFRHVRHEGYTLEADGSLKHTGLINEYKWTPNHAIVELNKFTNEMSQWSVTKLNANPNTVRDADFYLMEDASTSGGFVRKRFIDGSNSKDVLDLEFVTEIARKRYSGEPLDQNERDYLNPFFTDATHPDGTPVAEYVPVKDPAHPNAKSKMYEYIEPIMAKIISDRFEIEKATFDTLKSQLIAGDVLGYLKSKQHLIGINNKALKKVKMNIMKEDMDLLTLNGSGSKNVDGGRNQLKTLVEFIKDFDLQTKYLSVADATTFNRVVGISKDLSGKEVYDESKNQFIDESIWENVASAPQPVYTMVRLLDEIISKISGPNQHYQSIASIIDDILSTKLKDGGVELGKLLNDVVTMVTSPKGTLHYDFFGRSFTSSYMQNLAVGYNLSKTVTRYLKDNDAKLTPEEKIELGKVDKQTAYDTKVITRVAINNKYYNIPYFIDGMSKESELNDTISDLLKSDLAKNVTIELPKTNKLVDFLSNPTKLLTIGFETVGALLTLIGGIITFLSFKNKPTTPAERKKAIVMRSIFIAITVTGILLISMGVLLPILTASGKLAVLGA